MKQYSVIRMDLIDSRKLENRAEIQRKVLEYIKKLNEENAETFYVPISMLLGDEWAVVLSDITKTYDIYLKIKEFLLQNHLQMYTAIGFGTILGDTREMSTLTGTAIDHAKENMRIAKSSKYGYKKEIPTKSCHVCLSGLSDEVFGISYDELLNTLIQNNEILFDKMTEKQYQCICLYERYQSYTTVIQNHPEITKRMLSDCLNTADYWLMKETSNRINELLVQAASIEIL